jgi:hypothetical protein
MEMQLQSTKLTLIARSHCYSGEAEFGLAQTEQGRRLAVLCPQAVDITDHFEGELSEYGQYKLKLCPLNHHNASRLREHLDWLRPRLVGLKTSAGMGDRLGIATPGHVRAVRKFEGKIVPIFAQQSIREMKRTGRSPQQVMDDATWGMFEEGWQSGAGADADHLKTLQDIDDCFMAGFTFFTFDPGEYVDQSPRLGQKNYLEQRLSTLQSDLMPGSTSLAGKTFDFEGYTISMNEPVLSRAVVKYGQAIIQIACMYHHLKRIAGEIPFEVEISMDETEVATSPAEHVYIATELKRQGVAWVSFAPRFIGRFEKGVDYIGDLSAFNADVAIHAAIARQLGPYKLSLHSGSDKFSIYSIFMEATQGFSHLKTAGTSYLEALQTVAELDQDLIREIYQFSRYRFEIDKLSYHISADLNRAPKPDQVKDWEALFSQFDAREILHVAFGSILTDKTADGKLRFHDPIFSLLNNNREVYFSHLEKHFTRHLEPFSR